MTPEQRDVYYLKLAMMVSEAGTCPRRKVGAVVVATNRRMATGFNGAPVGTEHCKCIMQDDHCIRTVHAEMNALLIAGSDAQGATLYSTCQPCYECMKVIINARIARLVWYENGSSEYADYRGTELFNFRTLLAQLNWRLYQGSPGGLIVPVGMAGSD